MNDITNHIMTSVSFSDIRDVILEDTRNDDVTSKIICGIHKRVSLVCFFFAMSVVAVLSFERYIFFCHPFAHPRYFTNKRLIVVILLVGMFPISVIGATMSHMKFLWEPKLLSCYPTTHIRQTAILYALIFMLPTLSTVIFCVIKMARLIAMKKQEFQNQVMPDGNFTVQHTKVSGWSLRMVLIVSGTFWISYLIPWGTFGIVNIVGNGQWWFYQHLIKYNIMVFFCLSPSINPFIYLYTHKELRNVVWKYYKRDIGGSGCSNNN
jgi:hypothetical protein